MLKTLLKTLAVTEVYLVPRLEPRAGSEFGSPVLKRWFYH